MKSILSKTEQLAGLLTPFVATLTHADYLDQYFRCLFIRAEETEDLINANNRASEIFSRQHDSRFMPHLSLMYGDFTSEIKQQIIGTIGKNFNMRFDVTSVHLFSTNGEPKEWHRVKEFQFK
jgi:2'-5' RNA ligase